MLARGILSVQGVVFRRLVKGSGPELLGPQVWPLISFLTVLDLGVLLTWAGYHHRPNLGLGNGLQKWF